jgi:hypothetical protein
MKKQIEVLIVLIISTMLASSCDDCERIDCFDDSNNFVFVRFFKRDLWTGDLNTSQDFFAGRAELLQRVDITPLSNANAEGRIIFKTNFEYPEITDYFIALELKENIAGYIINIDQLPADTLRFQLRNTDTKCCGTVITLQSLEYSGDGFAEFTASSIRIIK